MRPGHTGKGRQAVSQLPNTAGDKLGLPPEMPPRLWPSSHSRNQTNDPPRRTVTDLTKSPTRHSYG